MGVSLTSSILIYLSPRPPQSATMERKICILLALLRIVSSARGLPKPSRKISSVHAKRTIVNLRGGDLGPVKGKTLATAFSVLAGGDAICGTLMPQTSMSWFGIYIPKDSLSHKYLHGIGASAATIAAANLLALSGKTSVERAIGYGVAARILSMTLMMLANDERVVGMTLKAFGVAWAVLVLIVYSLFSGSGDALALTKVASIVLGIHGLYLYLKPDTILKRTSISVGPDPLIKEILSIDGAYMFASAMTTGLLANGVDPVKVVGFTAICFVPVLLKFFEVSEAQKPWGTLEQLAGMSAMSFTALVIVGTLND
ncbi:expressed unknown protein [Seminavis robusta]|uniref:Uncharacterized protein n=1 Tax=Seminavis robusta TaxID=568900 RepID=A0A9N8E9T0_9STRA|nr:expressed unknown protein [Seminavis robusta]|eukprot:Sro652_g181850.1 n/a (314) ;mRNA; r:36092-37135